MGLGLGLGLGLELGGGFEVGPLGIGYQLADDLTLSLTLTLP